MACKICISGKPDVRIERAIYWLVEMKVGFALSIEYASLLLLQAREFPDCNEKIGDFLKRLFACMFHFTALKQMSDTINKKR